MFKSKRIHFQLLWKRHAFTNKERLKNDDFWPVIRPDNQQSLKEVIDELINAYKLRNGLNEARLRELWELMMGKMIASKTISIHLKEKQLLIRLSSSVLRQELIYRHDEIKKALNEALESEAVEEIRFS